MWHAVIEHEYAIVSEYAPDTLLSVCVCEYTGDCVSRSESFRRRQSIVPLAKQIP